MPDFKNLAHLGYSWSAWIVACHELILNQNTLIEQLIGRVEILEQQLKKDSKNSNRPPSSEGLKKRPALPQNKGKKRGGQKGNKLQLVRAK